MQTCNFSQSSAKGVGTLVSVGADMIRPSGLGGVPRADDIRPYKGVPPQAGTGLTSQKMEVTR